jgi:hypothetical protein
LRDRSHVTASFQSNEYGDIQWGWKIDGALREDVEHRSSGARSLTYNLNLERTTEGEGAMAARTPPMRDPRAALKRAKVPVEVVTVQAKGATEQPNLRRASRASPDRRAHRIQQRSVSAASDGVCAKGEVHRCDEGV